MLLQHFENDECPFVGNAAHDFDDQYFSARVNTDLMPGHRNNSNSMPLADYISQSMAILGGTPPNGEILVEQVKPLRNAEASGNFERVFNMLNPA